MALIQHRKINSTHAVENSASQHSGSQHNAHAGIHARQIEGR
jgi:hypothetical protein